MHPLNQPLKFGGMRGKFMLFFGALMLVLTASLTMLNLQSQQRIISDRAVEKALSISSLLRAVVAEDFPTPDHDHLIDHLAPFTNLREVDYVFVFDGDGRVITDGTLENRFHSIILKDEISLQAVAARSRLEQQNGDVLDITEPIIIGDDFHGGVRLGYSLTRIQGEIAFARNLSIGLGVIATVLGVMIAYFLVARITGPISLLTRATEAISEEKFNESLSVNSGDELQILSDALNLMARTLQSSRADLVSAKEYTDNIITSMLDMLVVTDPTGIIQTANRATSNLLGYDGDDLIGMHVQKIVPTFPFALLDPISNPDEHGCVGFEAVFVTKYGTHIPTSFSGSVMMDASGRPLGYVCVARDVTDRLATEQQLNMRAQQHAAIARLGQLALSSDSIQHIMDEAVRQIADTLDVTHNSVCEILPDKNALLLRAGVGWPEGIIGKAWVSADIETQVGYTLSVNRPVILENLREEGRFKGSPLLHEHGLVSGASVVIHGFEGPWGVLAAHTQEQRHFREDDINFLQAVANVISMSIERHRQEDALIASKNEAEEMSRLKSSFLANMSHEIRTPLTIMIGYAEALTEMVSENHKPFAERIENGGHRLLQTLNSVLELSRLQAKEMKLELEEIDIASEVDKGLAMLRDMASEKGLELRYTAPLYVSPARVDRGSLHRIIDNLVGNAIKFTNKGYVGVEISEDSTRVYLKIRDTGIGISQEFLPHLFDEFKQESTGESRSHEGSGLGLTITRQLVEMHGGRITVESEKGVGTTFTIWFPKVAGKSARPSEDAVNTAPDRKPLARTSAAVGSEGKSLRALVLDDSLETRELIRFFLEPYFHMTVVESAEEVFNSTWEGTFDIILLDINIGDEEWSGLDVLAVLRKLPEYGGVPIVAVTAYALPGDEQRFLEAGFDGYISKPFVRSSLLGEIERLVGPLGGDDAYVSADPSAQDGSPV